MSEGKKTAQLLLVVLGRVKNEQCLRSHFDMILRFRQERSTTCTRASSSSIVYKNSSTAYTIWNTIDIGLAFLAIGFLLPTVGETLRVHLNLIIGTVTCWCGILFIYIAVAVFTAVLKVLLDDTFGIDDY